MDNNTTEFKTKLWFFLVNPLQRLIYLIFLKNYIDFQPSMFFSQFSSLFLERSYQQTRICSHLFLTITIIQFKKKNCRIEKFREITKCQIRTIFKNFEVIVMCFIPENYTIKSNQYCIGNKYFLTTKPEPEKKLKPDPTQTQLEET